MGLSLWGALSMPVGWVMEAGLERVLFDSSFQKS